MPKLGDDEQIDLFGPKGKPFVENRDDLPTVWERLGA